MNKSNRPRKKKASSLMKSVKNARPHMHVDNQEEEEEEEPVCFTASYKDFYGVLESEVWLDITVPSKMKQSQIWHKLIAKVVDELQVLFSVKVSSVISDMVFGWPQRMLKPPPERSKQRFMVRRRGAMLLRKHYADRLWKDCRDDLEAGVYSSMFEQLEQHVRSGAWPGRKERNVFKSVTPRYVHGKLSLLFPEEFRNTHALSVKWFSDDMENRLRSVLEDSENGIKTSKNTKKGGVSINYEL